MVTLPTKVVTKTPNLWPMKEVWVFVSITEDADSRRRRRALTDYVPVASVAKGSLLAASSLARVK